MKRSGRVKVKLKGVGVAVPFEREQNKSRKWRQRSFKLILQFTTHAGAPSERNLQYR